MHYKKHKCCCVAELHLLTYKTIVTEAFLLGFINQFRCFGTVVTFRLDSSCRLSQFLSLGLLLMPRANRVYERRPTRCCSAEFIAQSQIRPGRVVEHRSLISRGLPIARCRARTPRAVARVPRPLYPRPTVALCRDGGLVRAD